MNRNLLIALLLIVIAQTATYFQLQSQFVFDWAKRNTLIMSLFGIPISLLFIVYTRHINVAFDGQTWPGRLIGFAIGAIMFSILSSLLMNEPINTKTAVCLLLSIAILIIQFFWK